MRYPVVVAPSELLPETVDALVSSLAAAVATGAPVVVLDAEPLVTYTSLGLGPLLDAGEAAQRAGALLVLDNVSANLAAFLDTTHASRAFFIRRAGEALRNDHGASARDHLQLMP